MPRGTTIRAVPDGADFRFLIEGELALIPARHEVANLVLRVSGAGRALPLEDLP